MFMHHWSVGLARVYALQALEEEIRRQHGIPRPPPRRRLRKAVAFLFQGGSKILRANAEGLAERLSSEPRPVGCG